MTGTATRLVRDSAYRLAIATRYPAYRRRRGGAAIFAFHNVVADDGVPSRCDSSLHVTISAFQDYLGVIADAYTIVPLTELASRVRQRRSVRRLAAITFDDAYRGVFTHAVPLLVRNGIPATIFVVSAAAAAPAPFWWDLLAANGTVPARIREHALRELRGDRDAVLERHPVNGASVPADLLPATWQDVRAAARQDVAIGSHSVSHRNLAALDVDGMRKELERARAEIGAAIGSPPAEVSYPYGMHNDSVIEAAHRSGYTAGVTMRFAQTRGRDNPLALPRINVPAGISVPALECWAAGLRLGWRTRG